jgi:hypothetical protein
VQLNPVQQQPIGKKNFIVYFNDQKWAYDVEGVQVSCVHRERKKNLVQLNPVQ